MNNSVIIFSVFSWIRMSYQENLNGHFQTFFFNRQLSKILPANSVWNSYLKFVQWISFCFERFVVITNSLNDTKRVWKKLDQHFQLTQIIKVEELTNTVDNLAERVHHIANCNLAMINSACDGCRLCWLLIKNPLECKYHRVV